MSYEQTYNVKALDDGYGDMKYDGKGAPGLIPSFITPFKPKPLDSFAQKTTGSQYIACEVEGVRYVVGDYAIKLDPNIKWVGGENKHRDSRFPIMMKAALGLMTTGHREVIDTLMMNLPIKYDTPERRKLLTDIVRGTHDVKMSDDGINFNTKVITVEEVDIKKQPFGSICDVILNEQGEITDKDMAKGFNVVMDIGARTLNVLTVDALEEQPELTTHTNDGMFTAYSQIGTYLENELNAVIPDGKLPLILQRKEINGRDLTPLIDQVYANHANTILNVLDKTIINSQAFVTNVIFTGGGAGLLRPYLEGQLKMNTLFLDRYSNARGLRKYGLRQAKKNIKRSRTPGVSIKVGDYEYRH